MLGRNTDWSGYGAGVPRRCCPTRCSDRAVLVGAGGAGVAVGYGLLDQGAEHVAVLDADADARRRVRRTAGQAVRRRPGRRRAPTSSARSAARRAWSTRPRSACSATPGSSVPVELVRPDLWVSDVVYFPLETELVAWPASRGCRVLPGGGMAVQQAVGAFEYFTGRPADAARMDAALRGADRLMRKGIATRLAQRRARRQARRRSRRAGFDGDRDLRQRPVGSARSRLARSPPGAPTSA